MLEGEAHQLPALTLVPHGKQEVVEHAAFNAAEGLSDEGLLQEEAHQRGLEMLKTQLSQALEDPCDSEIIVHVSESKCEIIFSGI